MDLRALAPVRDLAAIFLGREISVLISRAGVVDCARHDEPALVGTIRSAAGLYITPTDIMLTNGHARAGASDDWDVLACVFHKRQRQPVGDLGRGVVLIALAAVMLVMPRRS